MGRPRRHREPDHQDRWLVSYADFVTLLFAFFVVLYAISSVNEGKYRVLSDALLGAFDPLGGRAPSHVLEGGDGLLDGGRGLLPGALTLPQVRPRDPATGEDLEYAMGEIARTLSTYVDNDLVNVKRKGSAVEVEIRGSLLFQSGGIQVQGRANAAIERIAAILKAIPNPIRVEGHTDNVPIHTTAFPSNWELSAARAASVVHLLTRLGVPPERLSAAGYANFRPIDSNDTAQGRNRNRRVTLVVRAGEEPEK